MSEEQSIEALMQEDPAVMFIGPVINFDIACIFVIGGIFLNTDVIAATYVTEGATGHAGENADVLIVAKADSGAVFCA